MQIKFADAAHQDFFQSMQSRCKIWDTYHQALFYTLGLNPDCRNHLSDLFCFEGPEEGIRPEIALNHGWHTSGSIACVRLGYNLYNGCFAKEDGVDPYSIFASGYAVYFVEAVKLRYPETFNAE